MLSICLLVVMKSSPLWGRVIGVRELAAELSVSIGEEVAFAKNLDRSLVFVQPHGATALEVLRATAVSMHASVNRNQNGYTVSRTPDDLKGMQGERIEIRGKWLRDRLDALHRYRLTHLNPRSLNDSVVSEITRQSKQWLDLIHGKSTQFTSFRATQLLPAEVLLEELAKRIGTNELANLEVGKVQVYEDRPIDGATTLPPYEDLRSSYLNSVKGIEDFKIPEQLQQQLEMLGLSDLRQLYTKSDIQGRFRIQVDPTVGGIEMTLQEFDESGRQLVHSWLLAMTNEQPLSPSLVLLQTAKVKTNRFYPLSKESLEALDFINGGSAQLRIPDWFQHPERSEPLNAFVGEALSKIGQENETKCFVVNVSDGLFSCVSSCIQNGNLNRDALDAMMAQSDPYRCIATGNSVIWRPLELDFDQKRQADRRVLGRFARSVKSKNRCDLRICGLLFHDSCAGISPLATQWLYRVEAGSKVSSGRGDFSDSALKLVGSFSDDAWDRLQLGKDLTAEQLGVSTSLQALIRDEVGVHVKGETSFPDIYLHPTELYSNTSIQVTPLSLRSNPYSVVQWWHSGGAVADWVSPQILSSLFRASPTSVKWQGDTPVFGQTREAFEQQFDDLRFRRGVRTDYELTIMLPQGLHITYSAPKSLAPDASVMTFADLPETYRDEVWKKAINGALEIAAQLHQLGKTPVVKQPDRIPPSRP